MTTSSDPASQYRFAQALVALVLVLGLLPALARPGGAAARALPAVAQVPACDLSTNLITNGSFESPALPPGTFSTVTPTGWSGSVELANGTFNRQGPAAGQQFVRSTAGALSQTFPVAGRGGQRVSYTIAIRYFSTATSFQVFSGTQLLASDDYLFTSPLRDTFVTIGNSFTIPNPAPSTLRFVISGQSGGATDMDLDSMVMTANGCVGETAPKVAGLTNVIFTTANAPVSRALTLSDADSPLDALTLSSDQRSGSVRFEGTGANRTMIFTPDPTYVGTVNFNVTVSDGRLSSSSLATVVVRAPNFPPTATGLDGPFMTPRNTPLVIPFTVADRETDPIYLGVQATDPAHGTVEVEELDEFAEDGGPRSLTYTPDPGFTGTDTFNVRIADTVQVTVIPVTITVTLPNQPPVASDDTLPAITEDTTVLIPLADLLANDTAGPVTEDQTLTVIAVTAQTGATAVLESGGVRFTPPLNGNATTGFTYTIQDSAGLTDTATATIPITPVDDPVTAGDETLPAIAEDTTTLVPFADLFANDSAGPPNENQTLTITSVTADAGATATVESGGVRFTPPLDGTDPTGFTYTVQDSGGSTDTATVTIPITALNDPPVAGDDTLPAIDEDTAVLIPLADLLANDSAGPVNEDQGLTITGVTAQSGATATLESGGVRFTPPTDGDTDTGFSYTVQDSDGATDTATVTIPVTPVNDPPVAIDETLATLDEDTTILVPFSDIIANDSAGPANEDQTLTVTAVTAGPGATAVLESGGVRFTPPLNGNDDTGFSYTIHDSDGLTATATATIPIRAVNDAPVIDDESVPDDITVEATGPDGARITFTTPIATDVDSTTVTVTCRAPLAVNDDPEDPADDIEVVSNETVFPLGEPTTVTCTADDGSGTATATDTATFTVTVRDTTAPALTLPGNLTVEATSANGATVTYAATATDIVDGTVPVTCTPASGSRFPVGRTTVRCTATDAAGNIATGSFTVTVRDTTGPSITFVGGPQPNQTYTRNTLPGEPTCTATDAASEVTQCRVYGYSTAVGTHTLTARARDSEGNSTVITRTYTVVAGGGGGGGASPTPRPTGTPTQTPRPTVAPTQTPRPTAPPTRAPRPTATPVPAQPTVAPTQPGAQPTTAPTRPPRR